MLISSIMSQKCNTPAVYIMGNNPYLYECIDYLNVGTVNAFSGLVNISANARGHTMKKVLFSVLVLVFSISAFAQEDSATDTEQKQRYTSIFHSSDKDKDEQLSPDEAYLAGVSEAGFRSLDKDSDGFLGLDEFLTMVQSKG